MARLSGGFGETVWRVWGGYLDGVRRLSGGCGEAIGRFGEVVWVLEVCREDVERLSGGYRVAV